MNMLNLRQPCNNMMILSITTLLNFEPKNPLHIHDTDQFDQLANTLFCYNFLDFQLFTLQIPLENLSLFASKSRSITYRRLSPNVNGWQLAKMKKSIPDMSLP